MKPRPPRRGFFLFMRSVCRCGHANIDSIPAATESLPRTWMEAQTMSSYVAPKGTFDSESLNVLDRAFEITWSDFKAHPPFPNAREEHELKTALRKKLIEI